MVYRTYFQYLCSMIMNFEDITLLQAILIPIIFGLCWLILKLSKECVDNLDDDEK